MSNAITIEADCIVGNQAGNINHLTLVNPTHATLEKLQKLGAWTSFYAVALVDTDAEGNPLTMTLEHQWFIDCVKANSVANVWLLRFVVRPTLTVPPAKREPA